MAKTVLEQAREIPVYCECDILVVGAGPAGVTAAIAAAKNHGGKVVLLERYPYLGGMATGGQVLAIPFLSDGPQQLIAGIMDEWIDRLRSKPNGVFGPDKSEVGSTDEKVLKKYRHHNVFGLANVRYGVNVDPEMLKIVLNEMVRDYGITVYCHCWGCQAVMEEQTVKGVIFESKEGRKAILAKVTIDCTGDGDIFASAGADFELSTFATSRTSNTALVFRLAGVDYDRFAETFYKTNLEILDIHANGGNLGELKQLVGFSLWPFSSHRNDIIWINNWIPRNCMSIQGLTETAFTMTDAALKIITYFREQFPGMENAYLYDFASQVGTRGSRRLKGVERLTMDNIAHRTGRDDLIAVMPTLGGMEEYPRIEIPYGTLVPETVDGILAAGRCFSSEETANEEANWIPHCIALGEAAGTAAAIALNTAVQPRAVDIKKLQQTLKAQGVYLYDQ
ncbi:FAD-dependent oxidoreductase [Sporomusa termitida]|uniref:FAD dependent oxidoreductase n=1 Tax=Sporomusa termitida TaxID=2377 RepID=A0A517E1K5_9FIRM|nr:FAD-dependent oxidoreductase [Sporomusa termitida]QDR83482.1 FAD dependent oxidoreductase [Sporomusa termitida]